MQVGSIPLSTVLDWPTLHLRFQAPAPLPSATLAAAATAADDPLVLPSPSGQLINLRDPSPFQPAAHGKPLPPAVRLITDAFIAQHGLHPPAALKASLARYLNISAQKLNNHLVGRRRTESARQAALAAEAERIKAETERERETEARAAAFERERQVKEEALQLAARLEAQAEWERATAVHRHKRGLDYYWSTGEIWVEGRDIEDIPVERSQPSLEVESSGDAASDEYGLVDALFRRVFGQPDHRSDALADDDDSTAPALHGSSLSTADLAPSEGAYTPLLHMVSPGTSAISPPPSLADFDSPTSPSAGVDFPSLGPPALPETTPVMWSASSNAVQPALGSAVRHSLGPSGPLRRSSSGIRLAGRSASASNARRRLSLSLAAIERTRSASGAARRSLSAAERMKVARRRSEVDGRRLRQEGV